MFGFFDDSNPALSVDFLRLTKELRDLSGDFKAPQDSVDSMLNAIELIKHGNTLISEIEQLCANTGAYLTMPDNPPVALSVPRKKTDHFYKFNDVERMQGNLNQRQAANDLASTLVDDYLNQKISLDDITDDQRIKLAAYSGNGGGLIDKRTGLKGSAYEYYTPKPIAQSVWGVLEGLGYSGGKVLDPCAGIGIFGATAPLNTAIDAVELDETSGTINKMINESDSYNVQVKNFEKVAAQTPDEHYDAVVANVPFGDASARGRNYQDDPMLQKASLEYYFIMRTLDKLKGGGLAAFVVPDRCVTGKSAKEVSLRQDSSLKGEFLGAFRLPNKVFSEANADVVTCVMFYRKHTTEALGKINDLYGSQSAVLNEANVLWDSFVSGKYFDTAEGKKHILGDEYIPADKSDKYGRAQLKTTDTVPATAQKMLLAKLPKTRINWDLLATKIGDPIVYTDGDCITQNGRTLKLTNGEWVAQEQQGHSPLDLLSSMDNPYNAVINEVSLGQVDDLADYAKSMSLNIDLPKWMVTVRVSLAGKNDSERKTMFKPILIGLAIKYVLDQEGLGSGLNLHDKYLKLSQEMERNVGLIGRVRGVNGAAKDALNYYSMNYKRVAGFSDLWLGKGANDISIEIGKDESFEGLIYKNKSPWVDVDEAKSIYGDDFNPLANSEFCVSADGLKVCKADDYYVGGYAEFLDKIQADIDGAKTEEIKQKLIKQKMDAGDRVTKINVDSLQFDLFSPYVTIEEKAEFLRRNLHESAKVIDKDGKLVIEFNVTNAERRDKRELNYANRIAQYLQSGQVSIAGTKIIGDDGLRDDQKLKELRDLINSLNDNFHGYVRQNKRIVSRLESVANDPKNLRFIEVEDESKLKIQGMNEGLVLHGYQNAYVRNKSRDFGGINGFGVGLGKTFTALALVQYIQSIGVKKRTMIVVPSSVLSNWRKEASKAYQTMSDCLFVGLRDVNGAMQSNSKFYDEDLMSIPVKNPSKVFITFEAFERIKLKDSTIEQFEDYMRSHDESFALSANKKANEKSENRLSGITDVLQKKVGTAPYLEDLGIDSIVIDEAHAFKNSSAVSFKGGKYLSIGSMSNRGLDAQAKAWYIRGKSERGDGVVLLTATPITNSPLEVYSMLSLSVGHERVNKMALGVKGADDFMNAVCIMEDEAEETIDGRLTNQRVFTGLRNTAMLRTVIGSVADIKSAEDVGEQITAPDADVLAQTVVLDDVTKDKLNFYKEAYQYANDIVKEVALSDDDPRKPAYEHVKKKYGESDEVIAHPFNLINKMTTVIADPDLDNAYSRYLFGDDQKDIADKVIELWNKAKPKEERGRISSNTLKEDYTVQVKENSATGNQTRVVTVQVRAWIDANAVFIDSVNWRTQEAFEVLCEKHGLNLDCTLSPKLAALVENLKRENAHIRGVDASGQKAPYAKQIIFCDMLGMHNKIRKLVGKHLGIHSSQVAIITGQRNNDPTDILEIQNNFNAYSDDNYRIIIANEKAEVGINLQVGTQAIHHLTIGWTPDSLTQRNGRGVRQGNKTEKVAIYYYDAQGTFDSSKRTLVNTKADWIGTLMNGQGNNKSIKIIGGLSIDQVRLLIESGTGGDDNFERMKLEMEKASRLKDEESNRVRQVSLINTVAKQQAFINQNTQKSGWVLREFKRLIALKKPIAAARKKLDSSSGKPHLIERYQATLDRLEADCKKIIDRIVDAISSIRIFSYRGDEVVHDPREYILECFNADKLRDYTLDNLFVSSASKEIIFNENSELMQEHESELDAAQGLMNESISQFNERAALNNSIHIGVIENFIGKHVAGKFTPAGNPYTPDCFAIVEGQGTDLIFQCAPRGYGLSDGKAVFIGSMDSLYTRYGRRLTIVYPFSDIYDRCCKKLAKYEDDASESLDQPAHLLNVFSEKCALVLNHRKKSKAIGVTSMSKIISDEYFPYVIMPHEGMSSFAQAVVKKQDDIILRYGNGMFFIAAENEHLIAARQFDQLGDIAHIQQFCALHGVSASIDDVSVNFELAEKTIMSWLGTNFNKQISNAIQSATSLDELREKVVTEVRGALSFIDQVANDYDDFAIIDLLNYPLHLEYEEKVKSFSQELDSQIDAGIVGDYEIGKGGRHRIPESAIIRVKANGFNTKPYMSYFRSYSDEIQAKISYVKPDSWKGTSASAFWHRGLKCWEIPYGAWLLFEQRNPELTSACSFDVILGGE